MFSFPYPSLFVKTATIDVHWTVIISLVMTIYLYMHPSMCSTNSYLTSTLIYVPISSHIG